MKNRFPQLSEMTSLIKCMHEKFGINYEGNPRLLDFNEMKFRHAGMKEEIEEFEDAWHEIGKTDLEKIEEQFDAVIDNIVFALGTLERMGLLHVFEEGFTRVMEANMQKELGPNNKRGSFSLDLRKPEGWKAPDHSDLVKPIPQTGVIVLDGPDASGKSTLAEQFKKDCDAEVIHLTWNTNLDSTMDTYMIGVLLHAMELAKTKLVVIDRLWLSELIYADVFRGGTSYPKLYTQCLELLSTQNFVQVICLPEEKTWLDTYKKMCNEREELYGDDNRMNAIYGLYHSLWFGNHYKCNFKPLEDLTNNCPLRLIEGNMLYDFTEHPNCSVFAEDVIAQLKHMKTINPRIK